MEFTQEHEQRLSDYLSSHYIPNGLGSEESACSIAAINLAVSGQLSDEIPLCMSEVIGEWILRVQDALPDAMRNSKEWKRLLPLAAGTGRDEDKEHSRMSIILEWMWTEVLPQLSATAAEKGFGGEWAEMLSSKTWDSAVHACFQIGEIGKHYHDDSCDDDCDLDHDDPDDAVDAAADAAGEAANAVYVNTAFYGVEVARAVAHAISYDAARKADCDAYTSVYAASNGRRRISEAFTASRIASAAAGAAADSAVWEAINPQGLLKRLINA